MIARALSAACLGIHAYPMDIEVHVSNGLPNFTVVGLPDQSVKESRERVRSAIKNSGYDFPPQRITVNLAPANIKKEGSSFELPMALGILAAMDLIPAEALTQYIFLGELALDGSLRPIKGAIVIATSLKSHRGILLPAENAAEAAFEKDVPIYPVRSLQEAVRFLKGEEKIQPFAGTAGSPILQSSASPLDFSEVKGQHLAKRAIEIAVAGGHNLLFIGSPGSGKTMLARRIPSLLPPLTWDQSLEITKIYSVAGLNSGNGLIGETPFRSPHHTISAAALAGGGTWPKPGEMSLAHHGVLFLDEFPEFRRDVIEAMRNPIETGEITISRTAMQATYPAKFLLVAAMNPCPCGFLSDPRKSCRCSLGQIQKYQSKVSGPILDRIDLHVEVPALTYQTLAGEEPAESSADIRERIMICRAVQAKRYEGNNFKINAGMRAREIRDFARPDDAGRKLMEAAMKELKLSARAYYKILKVARTIADLGESENVSANHIAEAIQFRSLDRQWWR